MIGAGDKEKSGQPADRARDEKGADDGPAHVNTDIAGGGDTFSHDGDLISVLGIIQVNIHADGQDGDAENVQQVLVSGDHGEPSGLCVLVDDTDFAGSLGNFPDYDEIGDELSGDIVHHQGEQSLVRIPESFAGSRDHSPESACRQRGDHAQENQKPAGNLIAQEDHAGGRGKRSDQDLSLSSQIPETHAEGGGQSQRYAEQDGNILTQDPHAAGRAEGALEHGDIDLDRIETGGDHRDQRAQKQ